VRDWNLGTRRTARSCRRRGSWILAKYRVKEVKDCGLKVNVAGTIVLNLYYPTHEFLDDSQAIV
jgi:hypothetical protein